MYIKATAKKYMTILQSQSIVTEVDLSAHTVASCIYAPRFATLALVESVGGACMRDLTFYLANLGPRLDVDIHLKIKTIKSG